MNGYSTALRCRTSRTFKEGEGKSKAKPLLQGYELFQETL